MTDEWQLTPIGETALLIERVAGDLDEANQYALALGRALSQQFEYVLPALRSVLIRYDPLQTPLSAVSATVQAACERVTPSLQTEGRKVEIVVAYGGEAGPDLDEVAQALGMTPAEVVARHTAQPWRVLAIGFAPGFPYLGPLPPDLHLPRRATPRKSVPAGSVAIAAGMTGIYPAALPGGWHLIGRTDAVLFDPSASEPALLKPGDWVQFRAQRRE